MSGITISIGIKVLFAYKFEALIIINALITQFPLIVKYIASADNSSILRMSSSVDSQATACKGDEKARDCRCEHMDELLL